MATKIENPIFIVGCPRSGTTVLAATLNAHSKILVTTETHFFNNISKQPYLKADITRVSLNKFFKEERIIDFINANKINEQKFIEKYLSQKTGQNKEDKALIFDLLMQEALANSSKERVCEKTPQHMLCVNEILETYPKAKILHIVRDGRDTVNSLLKMPWRPEGLLNNTRYWLQYTLHGLKAEINLPRDRFFTVHFEDFLKKPEETLKFVCDFLDEDFEESMLNAGTSGGAVFADWENDWKGKASQNLDSSRIGAWRKELSEDDQVILNYLLTKRLQELNYLVDEISVGFRHKIAVFKEYFSLLLAKFLRIR